MSIKRSRSGRILHSARPVTAGRPMHLTVHTRTGVPALRSEAALGLFRGLLAEAEQRGLRTVAFTLMDNHIHWVAVPRSAAALRDATRYALGLFARRFNRLVGRKGRVFVERYWSTTARSARQAWNALGYVLRNPSNAGLRRSRQSGAPRGAAKDERPSRILIVLDRYTAVDDDTIATDRFLRAIFGDDRDRRRAVFERMTEERLPFVPLAARLQPLLPGL